MGPISDVIDTIKSVCSSAKLGASTVFSSNKSISAKAMDGTCVFPMVIDGELIPMEDAMTIARAWERTCASFVLTSFTMSPYLRHGDEDFSAADYVKKFHVNMTNDPGNSVMGLNLEAFDQRCADLGISYSMLEGSAAIAGYYIYQGIQSRLAEMELAEDNYVVESYLSPYSLNDVSRKPMMESKSRRRKDYDDTHIDNITNYEVHGGQGGQGGQGGRGGAGGHGGFAYATATIPNEITVRQTGNEGSARPRFNRRLDDRRQITHSIDAEFKKANDAVPTMLHIRVYPLDSSSGGTPVSEEAIDFVLGVKAQLHPVSTDVMVRELARGFGHNDTFFNFIKWTTGETRFVKDFLLNLDQQKEDAYQSVRGGNTGLLVASKRRKNIAKVWNRLSKNPLTPILTIVTTDDDFDLLREQYGYDIDRLPSLIPDIMNSFYLLGFFKVNMSSEKVDLWVDGQGKRPQTYTLSSLAKENTTDDRKFKEMMKMLGRRM